MSSQNESVAPEVSRRRIFVGDIQGCCRELDDLLDVLDFTRGRDQLYSVGDVINRGPESAESIRRMRDLDAIALAGNHEHHLLQCLENRRVPKGRDTLADVLNAHDSDELIDWVTRRPILHVEEDVAMVHAGLHPLWHDLSDIAKRLSQEWREKSSPTNTTPRRLSADLEFAISVRRCDSKGIRPISKHDRSRTFLPWDTFYHGERRVVFGHWAQRGLVHEKNVLGLDTGCVYGGFLTAWIAEEDRVVQVKAHRAYCPI